MGLLKPEEWKALWIGAPWQKEAALPKPARTGQGEVPGNKSYLLLHLCCENHLSL